MDEFIKKLIERFEESSHWEQSTFDEDGYCNDDSEEVIYLHKAISIVNQLAEEYNQDLDKVSQDWIPCSERLPDKYEIVLVWCKGHFTEGTHIGEECKTYGIAYCYHGRTWHVFQTKAIKNIEVIAWQPLPHPYAVEILW